MKRMMFFAVIAAGIGGLRGVASAQQGASSLLATTIIAQTPPSVIGQNKPVFAEQGVPIIAQMPPPVIGQTPVFGERGVPVLPQTPPAVIGQSYAAFGLPAA